MMKNLKISAKNHIKWEKYLTPQKCGIKTETFETENPVHKSKKLKAPFPHLGLLQVHISVSNYFFYILYSILINIMGVLNDCL